MTDRSAGESAEVSMIYGSVCSGIEAATVAWHDLGWRPAFFSEIDAFPRAVLAHHYPKVPLHGDFTTIEAGDYEPIDLLVGGTPCQDFSVAGLRAGMAGDRGNLTLQFLTLARRLRPRWLVWENVPGVLSSNGGRDFGAFLGGLGELGYGWAYRTLDAQYFGVPQRRRRIFVVGYLGDWRYPAAVLFERHSLSGDSAPSRESGKGSAFFTPGSIGGYREGVGTLRAHGGDYGGGTETLVAKCLSPSHTASGRQDPSAETFVAVAGTLTSNGKAAGSATQQDAECGMLVAHSLRAEGFDASEDGTGRGIPLVAAYRTAGADATDDLAPTLRAMGRVDSHANAGGQLAVAFTLHGANKTINTATETDVAGSIRTKPPGSIENSSTTCVLQPVAAFQSSQSGVREAETHATLDANMESRRANGVVIRSAVRRLLPIECERLQGFPDGWTDVPYRGKRAADGPRYKALGNSMAVPCMRWIGERIQLVASLSTQEGRA